MGIYHRITEWLHGRKHTDASAKNGGPNIKHVTIDKRGGTHTFMFGYTAYGKGHSPKGGHKPITIIDLPPAEYERAAKGGTLMRSVGQHGLGD